MRSFVFWRTILNKQQVDSKRTDREFKVGDWVFVRLQPYIQTSLKKSKKHKLVLKFYGPYQVWKRVGQVTYALDIPNIGKLYKVFHVSRLKKNLGPTTHIQTKLPLLDDKWILVLEPKCILKVKTRTLHSKSINEYLVKWKNLPEDEATWENEDFLSKHLSLPILHGWRMTCNKLNITIVNFYLFI